MTVRLDSGVGIALFVKTPGHSPLKTRLAAGIGVESARQFHLLAAGTVAAVARRAQRDMPTLAPHWAVAETAALDDPAWTSLPRIAQGEGDLGVRMGRVTETLLQRFDAALLLGADTPQITPTDLAAALVGLQECPHVLGPSEDGGFWLFATRGGVPPAAWSETSWSQADTAARFCEALGEAPFTHLRRLRDVDTAEDLPPLLASLETLADPLPQQRRLADWLRALLS